MSALNEYWLAKCSRKLVDLTFHCFFSAVPVLSIGAGHVVRPEGPFCELSVSVLLDVVVDMLVYT